MNYKLIHDPELNEIRLLIGVPPFTPEEHKVEVEMLRRLRDDLTRILGQFVAKGRKRTLRGFTEYLFREANWLKTRQNEVVR